MTVVPTHHHQELAVEEREQCWFTQEEFADMRRRRKETIRIMEKVDPKVDDGHQHCFRGLEFKTRNGSREKQWNVMESCMVVIDEQLRHQQLHFATSAVAINTATATAAGSSTTSSHVAATTTTYYQQQQQQLLMAQADDIARAYRACTESSQKAAFERGLWDYHAALECNSNNKNKNNKHQRDEEEEKDDTEITTEEDSFSSTVLTVTRIDDVIMYDRNQKV